jgi:hypothetical protein
MKVALQDIELMYVAQTMAIPVAYLCTDQRAQSHFVHQTLYTLWLTDCAMKLHSAAATRL